MTKKSNLFSAHLTKQNNSKADKRQLGHETMDEFGLNQDEPSEALERAIIELTPDLLLPKLISGEVDVERLDINIPRDAV